MQSSNVIGIPESSAAFEDRCCILFRRLVNDPHLKGVATSGSDQEGIDLIGNRDADPFRPVAVQCKLKKKKDKLSPAEAEADIRRALAISPALTEIYVVTTGPDDLALDKLAQKLRQEQAAVGRSVDIQIWGWDELQRRIREFPEALRAFDPDYSATSQELLDVSQETLTVTQSTAAEVGGLRADQALIAAGMQQMLTLLQGQDGGSGALIDRIFDQQIDSMRDLLNRGQIRTAAQLLSELEKTLPHTASNVVRSRIRANLGFAKLRQGNEPEAAELLKQAYSLNPGDGKARANRLLALILEDKADEALECSRELLAEDPSNAGAAAYAYQAATQLGSGPDPDEFVPPELLADENAAINRVSYLRQREVTSWREEARKVAEAHPTSGLAKRFLAEALLDEAFSSRAPDLTAAEKARRGERITEAAGLLQEHWDAVRGYENAAQDVWISVAVNLVTTYRSLQRSADARRVGDQAAAIAPDAPEVRVALAHLDIIDDQPATALERVNGLGESGSRTMVMLSALTELERWNEALAFATPERTAAISQQDRSFFDSMITRARLGSGASNPGSIIRELIDRWPGDRNVLASSAHLARRYAPDLTEELKADLLARLDANSPYTARLMAAELAAELDDPDGVVRALDGHVDTSRTSEPLAWLAWAFANVPLTPRVRTFFEELPAEVLAVPRIARLAGAAANRRGDLPAAEQHLLRTLDGDRNDLRARLILYGVYQRMDRRSQAQDLILAADERHVHGSAEDRMRLALLLRRAGEDGRALALGFAVASTNRANEAVVGMYPGLFFLDDRLPSDVATPSAARPGDWFDLHEVDGDRTIQGLLSDEQVPEIVTYAPDHPLGREILTRSVGDEIVITQGFGGERRYRVNELKHRYVWLLHDILRTQDARFPESRLMGSLTMKDGDLGPVLDLARQHHRHALEIRRQYEELALPLEALAGANGRNVLEIAELIPQLGGELRTCVGELGERRQAERLCASRKGKGAVLDTLTAWCALHLDLLLALKNHFGSLAVTQSTVDELIEARARQEVNAGREYMTLGYEDEQAVRQVHSAEDTARRVEIITAAIDGLRTHCEIMPAEGSDDPELAQLTNRELIEGFLDPLNLARQTDRLLLSDDLHYRQLARGQHVPASAWLQAAARAMFEDGGLDKATYALCSARLASLKHGHVSFDAETLLELLDHEQRGVLITAASSYIGGPRAEMISHAHVVAEFINQCWSRVQSWEAGRACSTLIAALLRGRPDWWKTIDLLGALLERTGATGLVVARSRAYVQDWTVGHFLQRPPVSRQRAKRHKRQQPLQTK